MFQLLYLNISLFHVLVSFIPQQIASKLKKQLRCVACFPDRAGFAIGSIEGRVSIQHIDDKDAAEYDLVIL